MKKAVRQEKGKRFAVFAAALSVLLGMAAYTLASAQDTVSCRWGGVDEAPVVLYIGGVADPGSGLVAEEAAVGSAEAEFSYTTATCTEDGDDYYNVINPTFSSDWEGLSFSGGQLSKSAGKTGHSLSNNPYHAPSCVEPGAMECYYCSACGKYFSENDVYATQALESIEIAQLDPNLVTSHSWGETPSWRWNADSTEAVATFTCMNSSEHTHTESTTEITDNGAVPSCAGPVEKVYYASVSLGETTYYGENKETLAQLSHQYGEPAWNWTGYATATATFTCTRENCTADIEGHELTLEASVTDNEAVASCAGPVEIIYYARVELNGTAYSDENKNKEILEQLPHQYGGPTWEWTGFTAASAAFTCTRENCTADIEGHTVTVASDDISDDGTEASCEGPREKTYTARVTFGENVYSGTKKETLAPLEHDFSVFLRSVAPSSCYQGGFDEYKCSKCEATTRENMTSPLDHEYTYFVRTVEPTCSSGGYDEYECQWCSDTARENETDPVPHAFTVLLETVEPTCVSGGYQVDRCTWCDETARMNETPPLAHAYGEPVWTWIGCTAATAAFTCENAGCPADAEGHTVTVTAHIYDNGAAPSVGMPVTKEYTASVSFRGKTYHDRKTELLPALEPEIERREVTVIFKVKNGAWDDGTVTDKFVTLSGPKDEAIPLDAGVIPAVGGKPNAHYRAGGWDTVPQADMTIEKDTTFTYTYEKKAVIAYTVTFQVWDGGWNAGGSDPIHVTLIGEEGDAITLPADDIPAVGGNPNAHYRAGGWNTAPTAGTVITADTVYTYSYARKAGVSYLITFRVQGGEWDEGGSEDKTVSVIGYQDEDATLKAGDIPAVGNKPGAGLKAGSWYPKPQAGMAIAQNWTFTYTFSSPVSMSSGVPKNVTGKNTNKISNKLGRTSGDGAKTPDANAKVNDSLEKISQPAVQTSEEDLAAKYGSVLSSLFHSGGTNAISGILAQARETQHAENSGGQEEPPAPSSGEPQALTGTMVVQHHLQAMNTNRTLGIRTDAQQKQTEKISSGYKINRAADDAVGLALSQKMRDRVRGVTNASNNAQAGISAVQDAEQALKDASSILEKTKELAHRAAEGDYSEEDAAELENLQKELEKLQEKTGDIKEKYKVLRMDQSKLPLNETAAAAFTVICVTTEDSLNKTQEAVTHAKNTVSPTYDPLEEPPFAEADVNSANKALQTAMQKVLDDMEQLDALHSCLDHAIGNLDTAAQSVSDAESRIRDTDLATEMVAYTKNNILVQSAQAMLAHTNNQPQSVLQLLE